MINSSLSSKPSRLPSKLLSFIIFIYLISFSKQWTSKISDNLEKKFAQYMDAKSIQDYVIHFDQKVTIDLDAYFLGQNLNYNLTVTPKSGVQKNYIQKTSFMNTLSTHKIPYGQQAITSFVGYCSEFDKHIIFIYTNRNTLFSYFAYIRDKNQEEKTIQQSIQDPSYFQPVIDQTGVEVVCPAFPQDTLTCSQFYGDYKSILTLGCLSQQKEPILVRFNVNIVLKSISINSCIKFSKFLQQDDVFMKYVSPKNNFVILEVEEYRNDQAQMLQFYVNIPQFGDQVFNYKQNLYNSLRLTLLSPDFFRSQIAQPLNLHGYAYIYDFLYVFNQLGELYFIKLKDQITENGSSLTLIEQQKAPFQPIPVHGYYVQKVLQASIWDEAPNRIIVQGRSKNSGAKSYMEILIDKSSPSLPILNNVFQNLNPYDSFYMNDRGNAMQNNKYLISQELQGGKKFILRIFSKDLTFYKMPIADYFVSNVGYIDARFIDYFADNILFLQLDKFQMRLLNGNKLVLGNHSLKAKNQLVQYATEDQKKTEAYKEAQLELSKLQHINYNSTVTSSPGFLQEKITGFNSTFRTKFIHPLSQKTFQAKGKFKGFYEIGEHCVIEVENTVFIGPNITLTYALGDNSNIPQEILTNSNFTSQKLLIQNSTSLYNPQKFEFDVSCFNSTFFISNFYKEQIFVQMCFTQSKIHCLLNERETSQVGLFNNFRYQVIDMSPYFVLQVKHDVKSKAIIVLSQLFEQNYIHVYQLLQVYQVIWRAKSNALTKKARRSYAQAPAMFVKDSLNNFMFLIIVSEYQELLMLYQIDLNKDQSITHIVDQQNPFKSEYGQLKELFYLPHQFVLLAYQQQLVISRANSLDADDIRFEFKKVFRKNEYIKIQSKDDVLLLFKQNLIEQYNFQDPFIPTKTRNLRIPYKNYTFYRDSTYSVLSTMDIQNRVISILQYGPRENADLYIVCFKTNSLSSHGSLLFLQKLQYQEDHLPSQILESNKYIFGYQVFNGANILYLFINKQFLYSKVNNDHIFHIRTPPYADLRNYPLNFTIFPTSDCELLSNITQSCSLHTQLIGEMSGAVIKKNYNFVEPTQIPSIIIDRPKPNQNFIMGTYFEGYNISYNITTIKQDPKSIKSPLLKVPNLYQKVPILGEQKAVNYTHQIIVQKTATNSTVIITIDQLRNLQMRVLNYLPQKNEVTFDVIHTRSINNIREIYQLTEITKQADKESGARTFWVIYGNYNGLNQIIVQNVTSFYNSDRAVINKETQFLSDFQILSHFETWYEPTKWIYDSQNQKFLIAMKSAKPFDFPIISYSINWETGQLSEQVTIDAILLKLNEFHAKSFFIHDTYPMLLAAGKSANLTFVDLTTSTLLSSINVQKLGTVLETINPFEIQWMCQKSIHLFYAFVKNYGMITLNMTLQTAYNDIDRISDIKLTLVENVHQKGQIQSEYSNNLPFSIKDGIILGLFFDSKLRDEFRYLNTIKVYNSYEAKRSKVLYSFKVGDYSDCTHPTLFYPSYFNQEQNEDIIFLSIICHGSLNIFKLYKYQFLEVDYELAKKIDPTLFPLEQLLTISAQNDYSQGSRITQDFKIIIQNSGYKNTVISTSVVAVIIFLLFVIFLIIAWILKTQCKQRKGGIELPKPQKEEEELITGNVISEILEKHKTSIERHEQNINKRMIQSCNNQAINLSGSLMEMEEVQKGSWGSGKYTSPNNYFRNSSRSQKYDDEEDVSIASSPDYIQKKRGFF